MITKHRTGLAGFAALVALGFAAPASAYPWMVAHGYTGCASCHVDPMGAGQLTAYGRGMDDLIVGWHAGAVGDEPAPTSGFLFGLLTPPPWLNVSANLRGGAIAVASQKSAGVYPLLMAVDAVATLDLAPFVAHASLGYGAHNVGPAVLWSPDGGPNNALVSREHWVGLKLLDDSLVFRAGRMPVPFGLRNNEHSSFVRSATRTDTNVGQQDGVAVAFANDIVRGEAMAIAGNYQVRPDAFRERGGAVSVELTPTSSLGIGASSLVSYAARDIDLGVPLLRSAEGIFARYAPTDSLALLGELDGLVSSHDGFTHVGAAAWLTADWAIVPGVHVMPALEAIDTGDPLGKPPAVGAWAGVAWYALPHTELRFDLVGHENFPIRAAPTPDFAAVLQLHLFL